MTASASTMLEAALDYASRGVPVFQIWAITDGRCRCGNRACGRPGKHPLGATATNGFKTATTEPETIRRWWGRFPDANIGTPTDWCVVLDVDPRHGGDIALGELERQHGPLPDTAEVLTGSGGRHIYFAPRPNVRCNNDGKVGEGLDIKAVGGYVLLPPSNHVSGGTYTEEILHPLFETPLASMPDWLEALATAASPNGHVAGEPTDWSTLLTGVEEGHRHNAAAQLAGHFLGTTIPIPEVEEILVGFAARCQPPMDPAEARRIVKDLAAKDAAKPPAVDVVQAQIFELHDAAEEWTFPEPAFIVEQFILERGLTWIGGAPKRYKSLLLYYICLAIACQRPQVAEKFRIQSHPKILYIAREDHGGRLSVRKKDTMSPWGVRPTPGRLILLIRPRFDLLNPAHVTWLRDTCRARGITVIVLDTWTALSPNADPTATKEQTALAAIVSQLAEDIDGAVVVIDHTRKNRPEGQGLSSAEILGPSQKWQAAEHIVLLETTADRHRLEVFIEGKDVETERFFLAVSPEGSGAEKFTYAGTIGEIAKAQRAVGDHNREAVHRVLVDAGHPLTPEAAHAALVARNVTLAKDTVSNHLRALAKDGRATVSGKGKATRYLGIAETPSSAIVVRDSDLFAEAQS